MAKWRARKSKSLLGGLLRVNVSNSGVSLSAGGPLGRVSVNSKGEVHKTTRIPGVAYKTEKVGNVRGKAQEAPPGMIAVEATLFECEKCGLREIVLPGNEPLNEWRDGEKYELCSRC